MALVEVEVEERVAALTLNRPDRLNALNPALMRALRTTLAKTVARRDIDAIVLTGAGRAFCAGGDVAEMRDALTRNPGALFRRLTADLHPIILGIRRCPKPVVAAINGVVAGGGFGLALSCDRRIAVDLASFKPAYATLGIVPDGGLTYYLPRVAGWGSAQRIILDDATVPSTEALDLGIIDEIAEPTRLLERSREVARRLARLPEKTFAWTKDLLNRSLLSGLEAHLKLERARNAQSAEKKVIREGVTAFFEKRPPRFR